MSYGVRWVSPDGKTGHWTAPFATRQEAEEHAALRQMANGLSYTVEEIGLSPIEAKPQQRTTMSYRVRYTFPDGRAGHWMLKYATREEAQKAIDDRHGDTGLAYTVEELPHVSTAAVLDASPDPTASQWPGQPAPEKPTSTTERLVRLLRDRHAWGLAKYGTTLDRGDLTPEQWAEHAIDEALDLAGYLMRLKDGFATQPGSTAEHHVEILRARVKELEAELAMAKTSLAKAPSVPVGASETPGEGGDSDRRRLEALERYLEGDTFRQIWKTTKGNIVAGTTIEGQEYAAPTLATLADKLMEKEAKL